MKIKNRANIKPIEDACEMLQEMYDSENMSISYATITDKAQPHKHLKMEEVYYVVRGKGKIKIGEEVSEIKSGDIIPIPKDVYHNICEVEEPVELIVVTYPKYDINDLIYGE